MRRLESLLAAGCMAFIASVGAFIDGAFSAPVSDAVLTIEPSAMRGFTCYTSISDEEIAHAKELGANTLRLMLMVSDLHSLAGYDTRPWSKVLPERLDAIRRILEATKRNGMTLIIDVHEIPGLVRWSGWKDFRVWDPNLGAPYQDLLVDTLKQLALAFKGEPEGAVIYELFNEPEPKANDWNAPETPEQGATWDRLQDRLVGEIRAIDTTHWLIACPPYGWSVNALTGWMPSQTLLTTPKIMVTVHMYHPHAFTHQMEPFFNKAATSKPYPGLFPPFPETFGSEPVMWNRERLAEVLQPIHDFQSQFQLPVVVTEFSAIRVAEGADRWLADVTSLFAEMNVGWTYHAYKELGWVGPRFGAKETMWELEEGPERVRLAVIQNAMKHGKDLTHGATVQKDPREAQGGS